MSEERGVWQPAEPRTLTERREWYRRSVETLWPGLTEYAARIVPDGVVVGVANGKVIVSVPTGVGAITLNWPQPPHVACSPAWVGSSPGVSVPISYPRGVWPEWWCQVNQPAALSQLEASLVAGMTLWFDRTADAWHYNTMAPDESPMTPEEAEQAADYLRGRAPGPDGERRSWFRRGRPLQDLPWRKAPVWRDLNGPTAEPWGRWFSTADNGHTLHSPDLPNALRRTAAHCVADIASVAARWDWTAYTYHDAVHLLTPRPSDFRGPDHGPDAPWPVWADERTAWRRLVQRAAELLFEANADAWQTSEPRRRVNVPGGDEWPVIATLLEHASADTKLYFGSEPQRGWGSLTSSGDFGSATAGVLWRVFHGWTHLRKCADCGRWVVSGGQRARTLCDAACKQARHRRTPGANRG